MPIRIFFISLTKSLLEGKYIFCHSSGFFSELFYTLVVLHPHCIVARLVGWMDHASSPIIHVVDVMWRLRHTHVTRNGTGVHAASDLLVVGLVESLSRWIHYCLRVLHIHHVSRDLPSNLLSHSTNLLMSLNNIRQRENQRRESKEKEKREREGNVKLWTKPT